MLTRLHIRNLAVVEDVTLELEPGLNVLTGSTGAGKSLIMGAVNLLLGQRATTGVIRAGEDQAAVEAVFESPARTGAAGGRVSVRREIRRNGRSHAFIDGRAVPVKRLQDVCSAWIEPHGQHDQLRLRDPEAHADYVDAFAGNGDRRKRYREALAAYRRAEVDLAEFDRRIALLKEKEELLRHRIEEIDRAAIEEGEREDVESQLRRLENAERIFETLAFVEQALDDDDGGAAVSLSRSIKQLGRVAEADERLGDFASRLEEAELTVRDCVDGIRSYAGEFDFDPDRLGALRERRAYLLELERRYGMSVDELRRVRNQWERELDAVTSEDEERSGLGARLQEALRRLQDAADELSAARREAAGVLDDRMSSELGELMISGARFRTEFGVEETTDGPLRIGGTPAAARPDGADVVRFRVKTNPGESEGPLEEIASTGELSRISLALKSVVETGRAGGARRSVLVFDELDTGVGADLSGVIAEKLLELSATYQIICITHMPQIAAAGSRHLVVSKRSGGGRTYAGVRKVEGEERRCEIARMLGGEKGSEKRLELAGELLSGRSRNRPRRNPKKRARSSAG